MDCMLTWQLYLPVYVAPPIVEAEPVQCVVQGNDAVLKCNVTGNPVATSVKWRRNGVTVIRANTKYSIPERNILHIKNTTTEDVGIYQCFASNAKGTGEVNIKLTVLSKYM